MARIKITTPETVTGDVRITIPGQDKAGVVKITYKYQTARQHDAWRDDAIAKASSGHEMTELLAPVIVGWDGLDDADDQPIVYSRAALDDLLDKFPASAGELFRGFTAVLTESRAKN